MRKILLPLLITLLLALPAASANCNDPNSGCQICDPSGNICSSCNPNYVLNGTACVKCGQGQYSPGGTVTVCLNCPTGCAACNGNICTECLANFQPQGGLCQACPDGTYSVGGNANCQNCLPGCNTCSYNSSAQNLACSNCTLNFGLSGNGICLPCGPNQYSIGGTSKCTNCTVGCLTCSAGYNNFNLTCQKCDINYGYLNGVCQQCPAGQTSQGGQSLCCVKGCTQCSNTAASLCYACQINYIFVNNTCTLCPNGTFSNGGTSNACLDCPSACQVCINQGCITCISGYTPNQQGVCVVCDVQNCISCAAQNYCQTCATNYTLGIFPTINMTECLCVPPFAMVGGSCVCLSPYIYTGSFCLCPGANCAQCDSNGYCINCLKGYVSNGGVCLLQCNINNCIACSAFNQCSQCVGNLVPSSDGFTCVNCNIAGCLSCETSNSCSVCDPALILQSVNGNNVCLQCNINNCIACSANNICSQCAVGYYAQAPNNCASCPYPCSTCNPQGVCTNCLPPYNPIVSSSGACFICDVANCANCNPSNPNICLTCNSNYLINGAGTQCNWNCPGNCTTCSSLTVCTQCNPYYYLNSNNGCSACNNIPQCVSCNSSAPLQCITCASGFFLANTNLCQPCPIYCAQCTSPYYCQALTPQYQQGYTLVFVNGNTVLAECDPDCQTCSSLNPAFCLACLPGYYLNQFSAGSSYCSPCVAASNCMQCSAFSPSTCLSCYPGSTLTNGNTCQVCSNNCATCNANNPSICTSCSVSFVLFDNTCVSPTINTACGVYCANCVLSTSTYTCSFCVPGSILIGSNCVPCQAGCSICSNANISQCLSCLSGYFSNSTGGCSSCSSNCATCSSLGCSQCQNGYLLSSNFKCVPQCNAPCAQCASNNPNVCTSCLYGFSLSGNSCVSQTSCDQYNNCTYCPPSTYILSYSTPSSFNQTCESCGEGCSRCFINNPQLCLSCSVGSFLNGLQCVKCPQACASCASSSFCYSCQVGYVAETTSFPSGSSQPAICIACVSPCLTCVNSPTTCLSCINGYSFQGSQCISGFNFQIVCVLNTTATIFNQNYYSFLQAIAQASTSNINNITVLSVAYSPAVTITMLLSTPYTVGSSEASSQQSSLQSVFTGNISGMQVQSVRITTNGGNSDNDDDDKIDEDDIILIATFVPIGIMRIIIYCVCSRQSGSSGQYYEISSQNRGVST